ncbi:MAG: hypothetical protein R2681_15870 [Pyrinomonadaceae bacterium]
MLLIIIDAVITVIFEIVLEFVFGFIGEFLFELGIEKFGEKISSKSGLYELLVIAGHVVFGVILGIGSTYLYSDMVIENGILKIANFIIMPVIFGLSTCFVSWLMERSTSDRKLFNAAEFVAGLCFGIAYIGSRAFTNL